MNSEPTLESFQFSPLLDPQDSEAKAITDLYRIWSDTRKGDALPAWSCLNIADLKPWMGWLTVYGIMPDQSDAVFRLVGSRFAAATGIDMTGKKLSEGSYSFTPQIVMENLRRIIAHGHACVQKNPVPTKPHNYARASERLWMPFAEPGQPVDRIMLYFHNLEVLVHPMER